MSLTEIMRELPWQDTIENKLNNQLDIGGEYDVLF